MPFFIRRPFDLPQRFHTAEAVYRERKVHRRDFLASLGIAAAGIGAAGLLSGCNSGTDEEILKAGRYVSPHSNNQASSEGASAMEAGKAEAASDLYPAQRSPLFEYGRTETAEAQAARYTNFYEFTSTKSSWNYVSRFNPAPWSVEVDGLCGKPSTFDMDDFYRLMTLEERHYRHRCVETWAMCVPWTGFPLRELLRSVEPKTSAKFVAFQTFHRPDEAPNVDGTGHYPWPYTEGLTIGEAMNELAFVATGMYGHPLLKQHGAPIRLVLPWKYGFKSIKSIVRMTLTDQQPATFWNTMNAEEYDFTANVNPAVPHPRWSQRLEKMLGTGEVFDTKIYNGYGEYVGGLYA